MSYLIIAIIVGVIWFYCKRNKPKFQPQQQPQQQQRQAPQAQPINMADPNQEFQHLLHNVLQDAVILDTETTGLTKNSEIVEISIIDVHGNVLLNTLVKPKTRMKDTSKAVEIHGIKYEMLKDAPTWDEIHDQVSNIIKNRTVIIYNADFDSRLMTQTAGKYELELPSYNPECAMLLYGYWEGSASLRHDGYKWHKLQDACVNMNVEIEGAAHRALSDCFSTLNVLKSLIGQPLQPRKGF